jgi:secretion/DNA translocation related TadE-like protein
MSGSVLALAIAGASVSLACVAVPLYAVLIERAVVANAADAAAVAAADARTGAIPGIPCERAAQLATANGATLRSCRVDGLVATVEVSQSMLGFEIHARASAGPPSA